MTWELAIAAVILYVQLGLFLLGYSFYRRLTELHRDIENVECKLAKSERKMAANTAQGNRRLLEGPPAHPPRLVSAGRTNDNEEEALGSAHQRVQLLERAHLFNLGRADLDFLTRVHRLKRVEGGSWELPPVVDGMARHAADSR